MKRITIKMTVVIFLLLIPLFSIGVSAADKSSIINEQTQKSGAGSLYQQTPDATKKALRGLGINGPDSGSLAKFTPAGILKYIIGKLQEAVSAPLKAATAVFGIILAHCLAR